MKRKGRHNYEGGAFVETVMALPILAFIFAAMMTLCRLALLRQRALALARFGTWLQTTGRVTPEAVDDEIGAAAAELARDGSTHWEWTKGRYTGSPSSQFYQLASTEVRCAYPSRLLTVVGAAAGEIRERVVAQKEPQ